MHFNNNNKLAWIPAHMSIIWITLLKVCPRSLLESWLRWLKNLMYKPEGLSLYPQEIQLWLCLPLISSGSAEGWTQTDPGQSDEKNKTKAKQTSKQRVFQVQWEICIKEIRPRVTEQDTRNSPLAYRCTHVHTGRLILEPMHCLLLTRIS